MPSTRPRRPDMSLLMSPTLLLGTVISIFTIGSNSAGLACWKTLRKAIEPAVLKACSELSTGWCLPKWTSTQTFCTL